MQLGVVFPQAEIAGDAGAVRAFVEAAQDLGYEHLLIYDHVLGADTRVRPDWRGPYTHESVFHEVLVVLGYLAAVAPKLELATAVLILPQRQTALVAKQAAQLDVLTNGRFRLGVGLGWNDVEFEALGETFTNRGRRIEEQVDVLRRLWAEPVITYEGKWHTITAAGINPLPTRQIPIWFGGYVDAALERAARLGDGFFVRTGPVDAQKAVIEQMLGYLDQHGRDPRAFGFDVRLRVTHGSPEEWREELDAFDDSPVTHASVVTLGGGLDTDGHVARIADAAAAFRG